MRSQVQELLDLQRKSSTGVIALDNAGFNKYAVGKGRPYSLFLFGDAKQFRKQGKLNLEGRFDAFSAVAKAFASTHAGKSTEGKAFFVRLMFENSRDTYGRLGVKGLPYLARISPSLLVRPTGSISIPKDEELTGGGSAPGANPSDVANFVTALCGLSPGDVSTTGSASRSRFLPLFTLAFLAAVCMIGYKLYYAPFMRVPALYAMGGLAIFWFSVSGGMYNIIRGVPFVGYDSRTRSTVLFMPGSGQMGAEGFIMGTFYMIFALLVAGFTKLLPTVKDETERRLRGWVMLIVAGMVFSIIVGNHNWKTHMRSSWYF